MFSSGAPGRASCRPLALTFSSEPTRGRDTASASARTLSESNTEFRRIVNRTPLIMPLIHPRCVYGTPCVAFCFNFPRHVVRLVSSADYKRDLILRSPHSRRQTRPLRPMPISRPGLPLIVIRFAESSVRGNRDRAETAWTIRARIIKLYNQWLRPRKIMLATPPLGRIDGCGVAIHNRNAMRCDVSALAQRSRSSLILTRNRKGKPWSFLRS